MIAMPYFMSDESWYRTDEDGNVILTKKAPPKAVAEYNKLRKEYLDEVKKCKTVDELLSFFTSEPPSFEFPLDEETESMMRIKFNS